MTQPEYRLKMQGPLASRYLRYDPLASRMVWEDNNSPIQLTPVGMTYAPIHEIKHQNAPVTSPDNPLGKTRKIKKLKIQLGLKCNYSCTYCNQGGQSQEIQGNPKDVMEFLTKLPTFYDGGEDGQGAGTNFQFWGGEPFLYWKTLRILAGAIRSAYPNASMNIVTNGSLLDDEKIEWLVGMGFAVAISHDGPVYEAQRGVDPLKDPKKLAMIKKLYERLYPLGRFGFNAVLTTKNYSYLAVRDYLAEKLEIAPEHVPLMSEEVLLPYDDGGLSLSPTTAHDHDTILQTVFWEAVAGGSLAFKSVRQKCEDFFRSLAQARPARALGQKCGMDRPSHVAVDLKGNVVTCQNTSADGKHRIGSIEAFDEVKLTTSHHWSTREECVRCPVVQLCQGACMFLEDGLWRQACDNSFTYNLAILAASLYFLTGMVLVEIEGPVLRRVGLPTTVPVVRM